jgi:YegS/Rv2252/BmrU family lipid kinase
MAHAFIVLNPVAGDSGPLIRRSLRRHFAEAGWTWELYETTGEERIADVMDAAVRNGGQAVDLFVAAGGDGTVSAVAGGVAESGVPLGIVPVGTADTFARELGVPVAPPEAMELLTGDHAIREVDAMAVGQRFAVLNVSVGISGLMMRDTARVDKRRFGRAAYVWTGFRKLFGYQPHRFTITVDGVTRVIRASEVAVVNSGALGDPSIRWSPKVALDDGRIDVCIIRAKSVADYLGVAVSVVLRRHGDEPAIRHIIAEDRVVVDAQPALPVQADGEFLGQPPVEVRVVPGAVRVVVPEAGEEGAAVLRERLFGGA